MSTVAFLKRMLDAGLSLDDAMTAAAAFEEATAAPVPTRSKGAIRQARYEERQRQKASENVSPDASDDADVSPPSLSPPPQTPPPHTHPRGDITTRARDDDFDGFWAAYPAKVGKKAARKAWDAARDRPALADLLTALDLYRQTKPPDRDWCHPSTWLSQGRWSDEPPPNITPLRPRNERADHANSPRNDRIGRMLAGAERAVGA